MAFTRVTTHACFRSVKDLLHRLHHGRVRMTNDWNVGHMLRGKRCMRWCDMRVWHHRVLRCTSHVSTWRDTDTLQICIRCILRKPIGCWHDAPHCPMMWRFRTRGRREAEIANRSISPPVEVVPCRISRSHTSRLRRHAHHQHSAMARE